MDDRRPAQAGAQNPAYRPTHPLFNSLTWCGALPGRYRGRFGGTSPPRECPVEGIGPAGLSVVHARIWRMPICDYFSAADDQAAVAVFDTLGGPSRASLDVVALKNI